MKQRKDKPPLADEKALYVVKDNPDGGFTATLKNTGRNNAVLVDPEIIEALHKYAPLRVLAGLYYYDGVLCFAGGNNAL